MGFYAHFDSKEALQAAAVAYGQQVSLSRVQHGKKKSKGTFEQPVSEPVAPGQSGRGLHHGNSRTRRARSTPELKVAFERGLEGILTASGGDRKEEIFQMAAKIGGIVPDRAVQNPQLSEEILRSVRQKLS